MITNLYGKPTIVFQFMAGNAVIFEPKEDITILEFAQLLPILIAGGRDGFSGLASDHESLPENLKRHFVEVDRHSYRPS